MAGKAAAGKQRPLRVLAAIICRDGRLLIARRKKGDRFEGLWEFPGGKPEPGEKPEECLAREMREEFGVEVRVGDFLGSVRYVSPSFSVRLSAYAAAHISGAYHLYEHDEIRWVTTDECRRLALTGPDRILLDQLAAAGIPQGSR